MAYTEKFQALADAAQARVQGVAPADVAALIASFWVNKRLLAHATMVQNATGARPKTTLADALHDLDLFAEIGGCFLAQGAGKAQP